MNALPSIDFLRAVLRYEPETGNLYWQTRCASTFSESAVGGAKAAALRWNKQFAGRLAMATANGQGYRSGTLSCRKFLAHRVAWALHCGAWPTGEIDHINGIRSDNRISNLRVVGGSENHRNKGLPSNNTSGCIGVRFDRRGRKKPWVAAIGINGKSIALGMFATKGEAIAARKAGERKYAFHPNHGRQAKFCVEAARKTR